MIAMAGSTQHAYQTMRIWRQQLLWAANPCDDLNDQFAQEDAEFDRLDRPLPVSVLVDQNAPPAGLIAIATRSFPVGAISSFRASALAVPAITAEAIRMRPARRGKC